MNAPDTLGHLTRTLSEEKLAPTRKREFFVRSVERILHQDHHTGTGSILKGLEILLQKYYRNAQVLSIHLKGNELFHDREKIEGMIYHKNGGAIQTIDDDLVVKIGDDSYVLVRGISPHDMTELKAVIQRVKGNYKAMRDSIEEASLDKKVGGFTPIYLDRYIEKIDKTDLSVGALMVDVVNLSDHNSVGTHYLGDQVLRLIREKLEELFPREHDVVVKYGGDEFVVVIDMTNGSNHGNQKAMIEDKIRILHEYLKNGENDSGNFTFHLPDGTDIRRRVEAYTGFAIKNEGKNFKDLIKIADSRIIKKKDSAATRFVGGLDNMSHKSRWTGLAGVLSWYANMIISIPPFGRK